VQNFGTCVWRTDAQWRLRKKERVSTPENSDFAIALRKILGKIGARKKFGLSRLNSVFEKSLG